MKTTAIAIR